jgi:hypothetical protein
MLAFKKAFSMGNFFFKKMRNCGIEPIGLA